MKLSALSNYLKHGRLLNVQVDGNELLVTVQSPAPVKTLKGAKLPNGWWEYGLTFRFSHSLPEPIAYMLVAKALRGITPQEVELLISLKEIPAETDTLVVDQKGLLLSFPAVPFRQTTKPNTIMFSSPTYQSIIIKGAYNDIHLLNFTGLSKYIPPKIVRAYKQNKVADVLSKKLGFDVTKATFADVSKLRQQGRLLDSLYLAGYLTAKNIELEDVEAKPDPKKCPPIPGLKPNVKLKPHQAATLAVLHVRNAVPCLIEMGGGKTLIAICDALVAIAQGRAKLPCIIMPSKLVPQFANEIRTFTEGIKPIPITKFREKNVPYSRILNEIKENQGKAIVLASYEWLEAGEGKAKWLLAAGVDMVILDEAHNIKAGGPRAKAVLDLANCPVKRVMSGTLLPNKPEDLVGTLKFLDVSLAKQVNKIAKTQEQPEAVKAIAALLEKEAVIFDRAAWVKELPPLKIKVHATDPDEDTLKEVLAIKHSNNVLEALIKAQGLLPKSKITKVIELCKQNPNNKILVFVKRIEAAKAISQALQKEGLNSDYYYAARPDSLEKFKSNPENKVLVAVDDSLQEGHNLQMVNHIIRVQLNLAWSQEEQALARAFRLKQTKPVRFDIILTNGTPDAVIIDLLWRKLSQTARVGKLWVDDDFIKTESIGYLSINELANIKAKVNAVDIETRFNRIYQAERERGEKKYAFLGDDLITPPKGVPKPVPVGIVPSVYPKEAKKLSKLKVVKETKRLVPKLKIKPIRALGLDLINPPSCFYVELEPKLARANTKQFKGCLLITEYSLKDGEKFCSILENKFKKLEPEMARLGYKAPLPLLKKVVKYISNRTSQVIEKIAVAGSKISELRTLRLNLIVTENGKLGLFIASKDEKLINLLRRSRFKDVLLHVHLAKMSLPYEGSPILNSVFNAWRALGHNLRS